MQKHLILILVLSFASVSHAYDFPYKRLNKLYHTKVAKCLVVSERYVKHFPDNAAPYYFAMTIHFENAQKQKHFRKRYSMMNKALGYAKSFQKIGDVKFKKREGWYDQSDEMNLFAHEVIMELEDLNEDLKVKMLKAKLKRLKWDPIEGFEMNGENLIVNTGDTDPTREIDINAEVEVDDKSDVQSENEVEVEVVDEVEETDFREYVAVSDQVMGQHYGLAKGNEMIPSYSLDNEQEMLRLINIDRKKKGLRPLVWDENLARAARYHANDMAGQDYFSHDSKDRKGERLIKVAETFPRIKRFYKDSFANSENIAAGNESAEATYDQWYTSPGHYANMFNATSEKVGIGVCYDSESLFGFYWVFVSAH